MPEDIPQPNKYYEQLLNQSKTWLQDSFFYINSLVNQKEKNLEGSLGGFALNDLRKALAYAQLAGKYGFGEVTQERKMEDFKDEVQKLDDQIGKSDKFKTVCESMTPEELRSFLGKQDNLGQWVPKDITEVAQSFEAKAQELAPQIQWKQQAPQRTPRVNALITQLEQSTHQSFAGKLKNLFVGNSQQYKDALQAMRDLAGGKVQTKEQREQAAKAIEDYVLLRGDKVRDHQYGKDRFDAFMKGLGEVMEPAEFLKTVNSINQLRQDRYRDTEHAINGEDYLPDEASKEAYLKVKDEYDRRVEAENKEVNDPVELKEAPRQ